MPLLRPYLSLFIAIRSDQNTDVSCLTEMVNVVNNYVVEPEEYLSDHVYYFDREMCEVTIAVPTQIFHQDMI